jgi:hypothetical protein
VEVLIPEIYSPASSNIDDFNDSPYGKKLENIAQIEQTCKSESAGYPLGDPNKTAITDLAGDIQAFENAVTAAPQTSTSGPTNTSSNGLSHLTRVFAADQVARKLFPDKDESGSTQWQYVLWVQALESGGSVLRQSNFLGTKIRFSGGAVDTYAVFRVDGQLACSGNVFHFQSPTLIKDLSKSFRERSTFDPVNSPILHSTCEFLSPTSHVPPAQENRTPQSQ